MPKNTQRKSKYHHLSIHERDQIAYFEATGLTVPEIAIELGRHRTTIWREMHRNKPIIRDVRYLAHRAHIRAMNRKALSHRKVRIPDPIAREYIRRKIVLDYSPEQIAGMMRIECPELAVSHETIYQFIYNEERGLLKYLRKLHKKRRKRPFSSRKHENKIPNRVSIDERPKYVETRNTCGHWETDTMISRKSKVAIQVSYERKSMYLKLQKLKRKSAEEMRKGLTRGMCKLPAGMRKTITYDNGTENAEHEIANKTLGTRSYFCHPYHSWEKGGVENIIGLIRQYLPKKTDLAKVSIAKIKWIERRLNNRPRKRLGYKTPNELFRLAVALAA